METPYIKLKCSINSGREGRVIKLMGRKFTIGREWCSVRPPSESVSRQHATLRVGPKGWYITDLESRNGTYVNGERVMEAQLRLGDRVHLAGDGAVYRVVGLRTYRNGSNGNGRKPANGSG